MVFICASIILKRLSIFVNICTRFRERFNSDQTMNILPRDSKHETGTQYYLKITFPGQIIITTVMTIVLMF